VLEAALILAAERGGSNNVGIEAERALAPTIEPPEKSGVPP
jgi:hypothetical protein